MGICEDQNEKSLDDRIDEVFSAENMKKFRDDVFKDIMDESTADKSGTTKKKRGRPNKGLTEKHRKEYNEKRNAENKFFNDIVQPSNFNTKIIERVNGEIINDDIENFKELFKLTCDSVLSDFKQNNPQLATKHPYNYFKQLLVEIKKNTPKITADDLDKCIVIWDVLSDFMDSIGLYITFETFQKVTSVYMYQLKNRGKSNPKYEVFTKKINNERDSALVNEIQYSPYNSTNKIFMAKVHGIVEKTEPKTLEVVHSIRNYDSLPMFGTSEDEKT